MLKTTTSHPIERHMDGSIMLFASGLQLTSQKETERKRRNRQIDRQTSEQTDRWMDFQSWCKDLHANGMHLSRGNYKLEECHLLPPWHEDSSWSETYSRRSVALGRQRRINYTKQVKFSLSSFIITSDDNVIQHNLSLAFSWYEFYLFTQSPKRFKVGE